MQSEFATSVGYSDVIVQAFSATTAVGQDSITVECTSTDDVLDLSIVQAQELIAALEEAIEALEMARETRSAEYAASIVWTPGMAE